MPVAALSSICDPTASVLPSPLSAMEKPNWAPSRGFDALTYAICLHVEVVLDFGADARAARVPRCDAPSAARPATAVASKTRQTLRLVMSNYLPPLVLAGAQGPGWFGWPGSLPL